MSDLTYEYPAEVVMQRARETRAMMDENARLRKALEFYANPGNWSRSFWTKTSNVSRDEGDRARAALYGAMS